MTGLHRSGTTLTCHLLNKVNNTVALHEPMKFGFAKGATKQQICNEISEFFASSRKEILQNKKVLTKHVNGSVPDNIFGDKKNNNGLRMNLTDDKNRMFIPIENDLTEDFTLCIKHNVLFALLLNELTAFFPCYAIIRNPLAILASWNSVDLPINNGHIPVAENIDQELSQKLNSMPDKIDRQFYILSWFFRHYKQALPRENIIRYEDIIASRGSSLQIIVPDAIKLSEPLINKNLNQLYDRELMSSLGERLLITKGDFWDFYTHEDVKEMLSEITE